MTMELKIHVLTKTEEGEIRDEEAMFQDNDGGGVVGDHSESRIPDSLAIMGNEQVAINSEVETPIGNR